MTTLSAGWRRTASDGGRRGGGIAPGYQRPRRAARARPPDQLTPRASRAPSPSGNDGAFDAFSLHSRGARSGSVGLYWRRLRGAAPPGWLARSRRRSFDVVGSSDLASLVVRRPLG